MPIKTLTFCGYLLHTTHRGGELKASGGVEHELQRAAGRTFHVSVKLSLLSCRSFSGSK